MADVFSTQEICAARQILDDLEQGRFDAATQALCGLKDEIYAAIPASKRQSLGITWAVQRISSLFVAVCSSPAQLRDAALALYSHLPSGERALGGPIFMLGEYGCGYPGEVFAFFESVGGSADWVVREFAAAGFRRLIRPNREAVHAWLLRMARHRSPNLRRLAGETLRPVTYNRWLNDEPEYSLSVLHLLFRSALSATSVGNNLSDLSRRNPELIFGVVQELVASGDPNSAWIAYRACRNLVKKEPQRVLEVLGVEEYHYKDRHAFRED
jgi:3-methyladenine DNA glycosylase AlkC